MAMRMGRVWWWSRVSGHACLRGLNEDEGLEDTTTPSSPEQACEDDEFEEIEDMDEGMGENPRDADREGMDEDETWMRAWELLSGNEGMGEDEQQQETDKDSEEQDDDETVSYDGSHEAGRYREAHDAVETEESVEQIEYAETEYSPWSCFDTASETEPEPDVEPIESFPTESSST